MEGERGGMEPDELSRGAREHHADAAGRRDVSGRVPERGGGVNVRLHMCDMRMCERAGRATLEQTALIADRV